LNQIEIRARIESAFQHQTALRLFEFYFHRAYIQISAKAITLVAHNTWHRYQFHNHYRWITSGNDYYL